MTRQVCEATGKVEYTSKHEARKALVGHLAQKSMRVYRCDDHPAHYHVTKMWKGTHTKKQSRRR